MPFVLSTNNRIGRIFFGYSKNFVGMLPTGFIPVVAMTKIKEQYGEKLKQAEKSCK